MDLCLTRLSRALVQPSEPTPSGKLNLSRIDKLPQVRCNVRTLHVFRYGNEAAKVIREALSKALVPYYPLAGRLEESSSDDELQISCTGEGVWFVEAFANCTLEAVNYLNNVAIVPQDDLLPDPLPAEFKDINPLVLIQVTSFKCQGFVIGLIFSHTVCDGLGASQFLNAIGELARGLKHPSIKPVWFREAIPLLTRPVAMMEPPPPLPPVPSYQLEHASVDIPTHKINQLKHDFLQLTGKTCSSFDAVVASIWHNRTRSINLDKSSIVTLVFFMNTRQFLDPPLPEGFYGNCFFPVTVTTSSGWLVEASHADVVTLIKEAKASVPTEFTKWIKGEDDVKDPFSTPFTYTTLFISEWGRLGFNQIDYGWGHPLDVVPLQGFSIIPVCIVGVPTSPKTGIRLTTWCVKDSHLPLLLDQMTSLT